MINKIFVLVIIIIIIIIINIIPKKENYEEKQLKYIHTELINILQEFKKIMDKHSIPFFIVYGTLLGSVREQSIIPYDDDIDLGMMKNDFDEKLNSIKVKNELRKKNLEIIIKENLPKIKKIKSTDSIFLDIFIFIEDNDKIKIENDIISSWNPPSFFYKKELFPLENKYILNKIKLDGPSNYENYLIRQYGSNWRTPIKREIDHSDEIFLDKDCNGKCQ